jgi:hypothetical protein
MRVSEKNAVNTRFWSEEVQKIGRNIASSERTEVRKFIKSLQNKHLTKTLECDIINKLTAKKSTKIA